MDVGAVCTCAPAVVPTVACVFRWPGANAFADIPALVCALAPSVAAAEAAACFFTCPGADARAEADVAAVCWVAVPALMLVPAVTCFFRWPGADAFAPALAWTDAVDVACALAEPFCF